MSTYRRIVKTAVAGGLSSMVIMTGPAASGTKYYTAAELMRIMNDEQRYTYVSGVMAGLSTARYVKDGSDTGSACIDRWFHDTEGVMAKIDAAFARFGDKSPSAILYALVTRECGK